MKNKFYKLEDIKNFLIGRYGVCPEINAVSGTTIKGVNTTYILLKKDNKAIKLVVSPYEFKFFKLDENGKELQQLYKSHDIEKGWQVLLIKLNGESYFNELEKHYKEQVTKLKSKADEDIEWLKANFSSKSLISNLSKKKVNETQKEIERLSKDLSFLTNYNKVMQNLNEASN